MRTAAERDSQRDGPVSPVVLDDPRDHGAS
jgi:hypothetical protein